MEASGRYFSSHFVLEIYFTFQAAETTLTVGQYLSIQSGVGEFKPRVGYNARQSRFVFHFSVFIIWFQ